MPIRLNDIEQLFRLDARGALAPLEKLGDTADRTSQKLDNTDKSVQKVGRGLASAGRAASSVFGAIEAASGRSLGVVDDALTGVLNATGAIAISGGALGGLGKDVAALTKGIGGLSSALSVGLVGALVVVAAFAAKTVIELNAIDKATRQIDDNLTKGRGLASYRAELNALNGTIRQYEAGTLSAADVTEEFNRFGVTTLDQAKQRIAALERITERLQEQHDAETLVMRAAAERQTIEEAVAKRAEARRLAAAIEAREEELYGLAAKERAAEREAEIAREILLRQQRAREIVAQLVAESEAREQARIEEERAAQGRGGLDPKLLDVPPVTELEPIPDLVETTAEQADILGDAINAIGVNVQKGLKSVSSFTDQLSSGLTQGLTSASGLVATLGVDLVTGVEVSDTVLRDFFVQLLKDLAAAIAQALVLKTIMATLGGGVGGFLGGLFQDPVADLFARFEGRRFADLFFQGVEQQVGAVRDEVETTVDENRDVRASTSSPFYVTVNEASPETVVEITDRIVEPRIRRRALQRTGTTTSVQNLT